MPRSIHALNVSDKRPWTNICWTTLKHAKKCNSREFDAQLKPVYIKPYPVDDFNKEQTPNVVSYHTHPQQKFNAVPFQQYQQPPYPQQQQYQQYQQYQQQPQYQQQQQYRQPQTFQQPQQFYGPGFGFQPYPNQVNNQVLNRKTRQAGNKKTTKLPSNVVAETTVAGEAELYFYNKLKDHMTGLVGNMSCIMHELGYFTPDNTVNIEKYKQEYQKLALPEAMKEEFIQNIDICDEVSQCLPDRCFAKYPYGLEYGRAFFFVACEKKKAMEVCLKKQMIDDYYKYKDIIGDEEINDDFGMELFSMGM